MGILRRVVPLYSCPRCGWATAASWVQAVRAHRMSAPDCLGEPELVAYGGSLRRPVDPNPEKTGVPDETGPVTGHPPLQRLT
jgi:hypothetical protein